MRSCNVDLTFTLECLLVDQGSKFGETFLRLAADNMAKIEHTRVEGHYSLGLCERYHEPISSVYKNLKCALAKMPRDIALSLSVKTLNDVCLPEGIAPSSPVLRTYPPMHTPHERQLRKP